jgi:hypothetical protein
MMERRGLCAAADLSREKPRATSCKQSSTLITSRVWPSPYADQALLSCKHGPSWVEARRQGTRLLGDCRTHHDHGLAHGVDQACLQPNSQSPKVPRDIRCGRASAEQKRPGEARRRPWADLSHLPRRHAHESRRLGVPRAALLGRHRRWARRRRRCMFVR